MARLISEEVDIPSWLEISAKELTQLPENEKSAQTWQQIALSLTSGSRSIATAGNKEFLLCRMPDDEVGNLAAGILRLIKGESNEFLYEPSEPSFELNFRRLATGGIEVHAWVDAGNSVSGIYTWDACGVRFCTTTAQLKVFVAELQAEFRLSA